MIDELTVPWVAAERGTSKPTAEIPEHWWPLIIGVFLGWSAVSAISDLTSAVKDVRGELREIRREMERSR